MLNDVRVALKKILRVSAAVQDYHSRPHSMRKYLQRANEPITPCPISMSLPASHLKFEVT